MTGRTPPWRRARTRLWTVLVAAVASLLLAASALQPAAASRAGAASHVRADHAGSSAAVQADISEKITSKLQSIVLKFAAEKLAGFAFNQLGLDKLLQDKTELQLNELMTQVGQLKDQVQVLENALKRVSIELSELQVEGFSVPLGQTVSKITTLYQKFYIPAFDALTAYVAEHIADANSGGTCAAETPCATARDYYLGLRTEFLKQFTAEGPASYNQQIHDVLLPGPASNSIMKAYGLYVVRTSNGFLNADTSANVTNFYNYWADYEALAVWMTAQWQSTRLNAADFQKFLDTEVAGYQSQEHATLPPQIPAGTVIALPANESLRTANTANLPMWAVPDAAAVPLAFWAPDNTGEPLILRTMNTDPVQGYGFTDWKMPSRSELDALVSRGAASQTAKEFLVSLDPKWPARLGKALDVVPYIWTTQPAGVPSWANSAAIRCENFNGASFVEVARFTGYVHTAVGPATNLLLNYPAEYKNNNRPDPHIGTIQVALKPPSTVQDIINACKVILAGDINKALGSTAWAPYAAFLATRSTGSVNYLP